MILVKGGYICAVIRVHVDDLNGGRERERERAAAATSFPVAVGRSEASVLPEIYNAYKVRESE